MMFAIGNVSHMCVVIQQLTHEALVVFQLILLCTFISSGLFMMLAALTIQLQMIG
jgi:hypothetical protein